MKLSRLFSYVQSNKRIIFIVGCFFALFFLLGESSFAAEGDAILSKEDSDKVVRILNGFITGAAAILGMVTSFVTIFLYPGWVNGTLFGLQDYLKEIWILISNVVYFVFAFILIAIAFMNIIGKGEGTWELKQAMPKFIIGVLMVPFSWFFVQFILSISAILTVGVLTLPYDSFKDKDLLKEAIEDTQLAGEEICKDVIINFSDKPVEGATEFADGGNESLSERIVCGEDGKITVLELFTGSENAQGLQNSVFGIISVYTYGILKVQELDTITGKDLESIEKIADLVFKIVFDLLFVIVYLLLMVALLLALFVRGVRLWVYAMLSPSFGLLYFFGKGGEGVGDSENKFSIKEFIALAMVPVYVSAALAFGLVFILVASKGIEEANESSDLDTIQAGGFSLSIVGAHGNGASEKSVVGKLIVEIFGVMILWIAVMAALNQSKTTGQIVKPIADFGNSVKDLAAKAPTYAPIIPTGSGAVSAEGLRRLGKVPGQAMESKVANNIKGLSDRTSSFFGGTGVNPVDETNIRNGIQDGITNSEFPQLQAQLKDMATTNGSTNTNFQRLLTEFNEQLKAEGRSVHKEGEELFTASGQLTKYGAGLLLTDNINDTSSQVISLGSGGSGTELINRAFRREGATPEPEAPEAGDITNNIDVTVTGITKDNAEERAGAFDGTISRADLTTKLGGVAAGDRDTIIEAFDAAGKIVADAADGDGDGGDGGE